ncbi:MAG: two-component regulator propeller domain-containing protein, partial [Balneolaceae bacterium]|nr:two-component regulator propeller domain-containing protein [Balneolaceae bacterium]
MKSTNGYLYVALLVLVSGFALIAAKTASAQTEGLGFRHFTPQNGFPSYVYRITQGPLGQIWMTGPSGLSKFDSYTVHNFIHDPADEYSVPEAFFIELFTDNNGTIWLSGNTGITLLDPWTERFKQISIPDSIPPPTSGRALLQTSDNYIWTMGNNGLYRFSQPTEALLNPDVKFYPHNFQKDSEFWAFNIAEVSSELIWFTSSQGLIQFDRTAETYSKIDPLSGLNTELGITESTEILADSRGNTWLGLDGALLLFRESTNSPEIITLLGNNNFDLSDTRITTLDPASDGSLFIGIRDQGVLHFEESTNELVQYSQQQNSQEGLSENSALDVMEDVNGNIWVTHFSAGMSMVYEKNWTYTYHQIVNSSGLTNRSNSVRDMAMDQNSNLWIGTMHGLAFVPADGSPARIYLPDPELPSTNYDANHIINIHQDGDLIFAFEYNIEGNNTIYTFDIQQEEFNLINIPDSLTNFFGGIATTESAIYWPSRGSSQLVKLNKEDLSIETFELPLDYPLNINDREVEVQLIITRSGQLYLLYKYAPENNFSTTEWSYFKFDKAQEVFTRVSMSTSRDLRKYIYPETVFPSTVENDVIWSLAENGFLKENLYDGTHTYFPLSLSSNDILFSSGFQASDGTIWFDGSSGTVSSFDPVSNKVNTYRLEFSRRPLFTSVNFEGNDGSILMGGSGGYIKFNPDQVQDVVELQQLHIVEFQTGTNNILSANSDENYEIEYGNNNISFSYLGVNYRSP